MYIHLELTCTNTYIYYYDFKNLICFIFYVPVAKSAVFLSYPAYLIVETVNILRKYGMSGLAGVLMRRDFFYAVETLKRITGVDLVFKMSLHELVRVLFRLYCVDYALVSYMFNCRIVFVYSLLLVLSSILILYVL